MAQGLGLDLKESTPVEFPEFGKARDVETESAFCWWIPYVLRKGDVKFYL